MNLASLVPLCSIAGLPFKALVPGKIGGFMHFNLSHCGIIQPCQIYKVCITDEIKQKIRYLKGLYIWYLPLCSNPKCKKKRRAIYYALDGWNNWHQLQDVPKKQIDEVIKVAQRVKKTELKQFRQLSKQTTKETRFYLYASAYGRKVKCYSSKLGKLASPDENLLAI